MAISFAVTLFIFATVFHLIVAEDPGLAWIWPPPVGFDLTTANIAPCGGFNTSHDGNITYFIDQLRWNQTAAEISYMTRLSQNLNASDPNNTWSDLYPTIEAILGDENANEASQFCVPIPVRPESDTSVFQLIANTPAGIVFACSKVRFVRDAERSYAQACNPSIRGNSTVSNVTDTALLSAAMLTAGATATVSTTTFTASPTASQSTTLHNAKHLSGGAIAGIVVGSLVGAIALIAGLLLLLHQRRRKTASKKASQRKSSTTTSTTFSHSPSSNHSQPALDKEFGPRELLADVPAELDSSQRMELPATDSEKMYRPELAGDSALAPVDEKDRTLFSTEETPRTPSPAPVVSPNRHSYAGTADTMSSVLGNDSDTMSPVSPIEPDSPVFHRMSLH